MSLRNRLNWKTKYFKLPNLIPMVPLSVWPDWCKYDIELKKKGNLIMFHKNKTTMLFFFSLKLALPATSVEGRC